MDKLPIDVLLLIVGGDYSLWNALVRTARCVGQQTCAEDMKKRFTTAEIRTLGRALYTVPLLAGRLHAPKGCEVKIDQTKINVYATYGVISHHLHPAIEIEREIDSCLLTVQIYDYGGGLKGNRHITSVVFNQYNVTRPIVAKIIIADGRLYDLTVKYDPGHSDNTKMDTSTRGREVIDFLYTNYDDEECDTITRRGHLSADFISSKLNTMIEPIFHDISACPKFIIDIGRCVRDDFCI